LGSLGVLGAAGFLAFLGFGAVAGLAATGVVSGTLAASTGTAEECATDFLSTLVLNHATIFLNMFIPYFDRLLKKRGPSILLKQNGNGNNYATTW